MRAILPLNLPASVVVLYFLILNVKENKQEIFTENLPKHFINHGEDPILKKQEILGRI